jgi:hypothetical protein
MNNASQAIIAVTMFSKDMPLRGSMGNTICWASMVQNPSVYPWSSCTTITYSWEVNNGTASWCTVQACAL